MKNYHFLRFFAVLVTALILFSFSTSQVFSQESDSDQDGIVDRLELWVAQSFMPIFEYDENERDPIAGTYGIYEYQDVVYLYQVTPVWCNYVPGDDYYYLQDYQPGAPLERVLLTVVATYEYDFVPVDLAGPDTFLSNSTDLDFDHYGDTERAQLCINWTTNPDNSITTSLQYVLLTRHHFGPIFYWYSNFEYPVDGLRIRLQVSEGKHAAYATHDECEDAVSFMNGVLGIMSGEIHTGITDLMQSLYWDEDCSFGNVIYPTVTQQQNVGEFAGRTVYIEELGDPRISALFPGEAIWSIDGADARSQYFCGGYDVPSYNQTHNVSPGFDDHWCAGGLTSKWYSPQCPFAASYCTSF
ncbi:MAG: hypothetical protein U0670_06685 [Anaerolineae bacterium]